MRDRSIVQPQTVSAQPSAEPRTTPQQTNRWPWACTPIVPLSSLPRPTPPGRLGLCAAPLCAPPAGPLALPQALALAAPLPGTRSLHFLIYCPVPREASCPPLDVGGLRSAPHFAAPEVLCMTTSSSFPLRCLPRVPGLSAHIIPSPTQSSVHVFITGTNPTHKSHERVKCVWSRTVTVLPTVSRAL